jgi:hypothetical protein
MFRPDNVPHCKDGGQYHSAMPWSVCLFVSTDVYFTQTSSGKQIPNNKYLELPYGSECWTSMNKETNEKTGDVRNGFSKRRRRTQSDGS